MMDNLNQLRDELQRSGVTDSEWEDLLEERPDIEDDVLVGVEDQHVEELLTYVRYARKRTARLRSASASNKPASVARDATKVGARDEAVSILYAVDAATQPTVVAFRREVLRGRLMQQDRVEDWVKRRARKDGEPTPYLRVPIPAGFTGDSEGITIEPSPFPPGAVITPEYDTLELASPRGLLSFRVHADGVLARLRGVAEALARRYGWHLGEASTFVLTDAIPFVQSIRSEWTKTLGGNAPTPRARVVLTVDPATTPNELRDRYQRERSNLFRGRRYRTLSTKHLRLAAHDLLQPDDASPAERMAAWNDRNRDLRGYAYGHVSNYVRDAKAARERLTSLPVDWRSLISTFVEEA